MDECRLQLGIDTVEPPVIHASGELDYQNCSELADLIDKAFATPPGNSVLLDLAGLDFVDSSGLRVLVMAGRRAREAGGSAAISSWTRQLEHVLHLSGLGELFDFHTLPVDLERSPLHDYALLEECSFELPSCKSACGAARNLVCSFAAKRGNLGPDALDDVRLAMGEAVANAVRHGASEGDTIAIRCRMEDECLLISMTYPGEVFDPDEVPTPTLGPGCDGGMGIYFMKLVMDEVRYDFSDGHTTLTLKKCMG